MNDRCIPRFVQTLGELQDYLQKMPLVVMHCLHCKHDTSIDIRSFVIFYGTQFPLEQLRASMSCGRCGNHMIELQSTLWNSTAICRPASNVVNLADYQWRRCLRATLE